MQALDPLFADRVRASFDRQPAMRTLGVMLQDVAPGEVVLRMLHRPELTQQHGFIHAGVLAATLDSACGHAAFSLMPADAAVLTRSEEHTSELQSRRDLVCRLLL